MTVPPPRGPAGAPNLSALLRRPHARFIAEIHRALDAAGFGDIPPPYYAVFWNLDHDGTRLTALADRAQVTKQLMNYFVNHLVELGYLERSADPTDGRARLVRFTERGQALERTAEQVITRIEADWAGRLGAGAMRQLRRLLIELDAAVVGAWPE